MAAETAKKEEAPTYHRDRLIAEAGAFFGQPDYVVVGAFEMAKGNKVHYTRDETERLIKLYLDHPVENDHTMADAPPAAEEA